jgi:D-alanyl-D-alanine carboxypeptidase
MILAKTVAALATLMLVLVPGSSWNQVAAQETEEQTAPDPPKLRATAWALVDADSRRGRTLTRRSSSPGKPNASWGSPTAT